MRWARGAALGLALLAGSAALAGQSARPRKADFQLIEFKPGVLAKNQELPAMTPPSQVDIVNNRLVYLGSEPRIAVFCGDWSGDLGFHIAGLTNPDLEFSKGATATFLVMNHNWGICTFFLMQDVPSNSVTLYEHSVWDAWRKYGKFNFQLLPGRMPGWRPPWAVMAQRFTVTMKYKFDGVGEAWYVNVSLWATSVARGRIWVAP